MMDRLAAIEIFIRVVDTGSFSAAARHYDVGQPAVSKAIAQLEEWLGVKLLLRTTRALTPTEAGTSFYQRARRAVEEADEAVLAARGTASGLAGKLRVSAAVCFARLHIVPRLPEFLAQHPNLELELVLDDRNIDLVEEGIDLALRMGVLADSNMTARRLAEARRRVVGTPEYFEREGIPTSGGHLYPRRRRRRMEVSQRDCRGVRQNAGTGENHGHRRRARGRDCRHGACHCVRMGFHAGVEVRQGGVRNGRLDASDNQPLGGLSNRTAREYQGKAVRYVRRDLPR
jgi:DNA-binding transcriptional LysR family regulator